MIRIDRLPAQNAISRRSLGGSLKILFRKLVARRVGVAYDWPHLSLVRYDEATGTPRYEYDPAAVRAGLVGASTVLLLVHGIIGDTRGMSQAAGPGPVGATPGFGDGFDAVLALDYENVQTKIETSGADLATALRAVGIDADDPAGPRLTVVAHSMGGLVSRCFIEREGGHTVVDRLVTCGTPHAGSPWPRVEDSVTSLLGLGLNGVIPLSGPLASIGAVLAFLAGAVERVDNALDEMRSGSTLLQQLAAAPAPGVPYVVIRGTQPLPFGSNPGVAKRIVRKLTGSALDLLFGGQPNDLAVSVESATAVGGSWPVEQRPRPIDAACNHVTYFSGDTGLTAVRSALTG